MGWIMHDAPGIGNGPCEKDCKHKDCEATRQDAEAKCRWCGKPIGYGVRFYMDRAPTKSGWSYMHFVCALLKDDRDRKSQQKKNALATLNE